MNSRQTAIHRRQFIRSLCAAVPVFSFDQLVLGLPLGVRFVNVAREAGLQTKTIFGGEQKNKFLMETTGCGCAFFDYDNDGWLDIFLVNGTRLPGRYPASHRCHNRRTRIRSRWFPSGICSSARRQKWSWFASPPRAPHSQTARPEAAPARVGRRRTPARPRTATG